MRRPWVAVAAACGVLLVVGGVALWWAFASADRWVARAIERAGSRALGVPVRVERVDLDLREGRGVVRGLRVANPEGFSEEPILRVEEIVLHMRPAAVRAEPIVVDEVSVLAPVVVFEVDEGRGANLDVLRTRARGRAEAPPQPPPVPREERLRLRLRRVAVEEGRIVADLTALGGGRRRLDLPPLVLRDVGGVQGAPPSEVASTVAIEVNSRSRTPFRYQRIVDPSRTTTA